MAGGNLGDLEFSLSLKSRVEQEVNNIVKAMNKLDASGDTAQRALDGIVNAFAKMRGGQTDAVELIKLYKELETRLKQCRAEEQAFDQVPGTEEAYQKLTRTIKRLDAAKSSLDGINSILQELSRNRLDGISIFPDKTATEATKALKAMMKLKDLMNELGQLSGEGVQKLGVGATDRIRQAVSELEKFHTVLGQYAANGGRNPFNNSSASALLESAEYAKMLNEATNSAKDLKQALIDAAEAEKVRNQIAIDKGVWASMQSEAQAAQELAAREKELLQLKQAIAERDRQASEHGAFVAMQSEAQAAQELAARERELSALKAAMIRRNDEVAAAEKRLAEAIQKTNEARRAAVSASRNQAESLVRDRIKELEAQRQQLQGVYGHGKGVLSAEELQQIKGAFSQITKELNTLHDAMSNLGGRSIKDLFAMSRGTSDYAPLISSMNTAIEKKREAIELEKKHQQEIAQTAATAKNDLANAFANANKEANKMSGVLNDIKSLFLQGGIVYGAKQFFDSIVQTGGEIVQQHVALRSILGDVQKADELFEQTQQLALQSPFKFGELNRDVKQLAAFGVEANDLYDTTKRLADIASGLGVSFERLGLAYGQVKARSWLDGKELRQFAYAGLPLLQKIAELYNSTGKGGKTDYKAGDIKKMITAREVSFEDVQKVLWQMTDEGGQFYNMQLVLSNTLLGRWNKLIDAWDIMLGKMADGKNVVGSVFTFMIDRVTDLVLALDKLSPAVMTFGGLLALRKGVAMLGGKTGLAGNQVALQAQQAARLRTYAIEQQQLVVEGKITQEIAMQNVQKRAYLLADQASVQASWERAAIEGRLTAMQIQKAHREGLISSELVQQLEVMGAISAKESELIVKDEMRARAQLGLMEAGKKMSGLFSMWNIATIGITAVVGVLSAWRSHVKSIEQDTSNIAANARSNYEALSQVLSEVSQKGSGEVLQEQVDKMTDVLKQSGLYTETIKAQIDSTADLGKEYDILKEKIEAARSASNFTPGEAEAYAKSKKATGAGFAGGSSFFGQITGMGQDDIDENVNDVATRLANLQVKMEKFSDTTKSSMEKVANSILGARAAGMSFEEKIATICSERGVNGYWDTFVKKVSGGREDVANDLKGLQDELDSFGRNFGEITTDDIPKYMEEMAKSRNMSMDEFSKWCQQHPEKFRTMLDQMLSEADKKVPNLVKRLQQVALAILNIGTMPTEGEKKPAVWKNPLKVGTIDRKAFDKLYAAGKLKGGKGGFYQKEMAELIFGLNNGRSSGWENLGEAVRKQYKSVRNENDAAKAAGEKAPQARKQAMLEAIANQLGIDLDVGKNKVTGNYGKDKHTRQEDKELKELRQRLEDLKAVRKSYQEKKNYMSDADAMEMALRAYPNVRGLDISDYEGTVRKLISGKGAGFWNKSTERKNFLTKLNGELDDWHVAEKLKPQFEEAAATFKEALERKISQFDLFRTLIEKTGSEIYASKAFVDGARADDKVRALMEDYKKQYGKDFVIDDAMQMTDGEAKKELRGAGEYDAWKKITDLLRSNYVQSLNDGADAVQKTLTLAEKLANIQRKYDKLIGETDDEGLKERYRYLMKDEQSGVLLEDLKSQINWDGVFGNLDNYTKKELKKIRAQMKGLVKGGLLDKMQPDDIKTFYDGAQKLDEAINGKSFGGLSGLVKDLAVASKDYDDAAQTYKDNLKKYGPDHWQTENAKKAMDAAENRMNNARGQVQNKEGDILDNVVQLGNMFTTLGRSDGSGSTLLNNAGSWAQSIASMSGASDKNSQKIGSIVGMFAGLTEAIAEKGLDGFLSDAFEDIGTATTKSFKTLFGINIGLSGADYDDYKDAKTEYENLINVWDTLIQRKQEYLSENWGTEATAASQEAMRLLQSQIEQTKEIAKERLKSGASAGSHTIGYRMWQGSYDYNGTKWRDVADEISSKYGVKFTSMSDMLDMDADTLEKIQTDYSGLWAHLDGDFKSYLEKIIEYGDQIDDMAESLTEKLTGNKFSSLVESWADAMGEMSQSSDNLVESFENNLKSAILKSMVQNIYGTKIKALLSKTQSYAENGDNLTDSSGNVISEYTGAEYADIKDTTEELTKEIETTRDYLKRIYGWSDSSTSSTTNSVKGITEETADLLASYLNAIRLDVSVDRENVARIAEIVAQIPEIGVIAQSQLTAMNQLVSLAEARNGKLDDMYTWMKHVTSGVKKISVN